MRDCRMIVTSKVATVLADRFFPNLLSSTLSRQGLLDSALRARLQIEGVALHFLNDLLRLDLALEATEGVVYRLAFLQPNFCQTCHPLDQS